MTPDDAEKYLTHEVRDEMRAVGVLEQDKVLLKHYPTLTVTELVCLLTWHEEYDRMDTAFLKCVDDLVQAGAYKHE